MAYPYPNTNSQLIRHLNLAEHFEAGHFVQTDVVKTGDKLDATQIYYLLTPKGNARSGMHMNQHATFHTHHQGRSNYTLIHPPTSPASAPTIKHITVGSNLAAGEVLQLFVPGGWWKASEIPLEDIEAVRNGERKAEETGCLISEVVVPGWVIEQHGFLTEDKLKAMWNGKTGWQEFAIYLRENIEVYNASLKDL